MEPFSDDSLFCRKTVRTPVKLKYLGTAAAERVPAIFCDCEVCNYARQHKGRDIRTQTQSLLDDGRLLIDFPGDSYLHMLEHQLNFNDIEHLLITHWHSDHFYPEDLTLRMQGYGQNLTKVLHVYGSSYVKDFYDRAFNLEGRTDESRIKYHLLEPYHKYNINDYNVYPIIAQHGHFDGDCLIYAIQDCKSKKTLLYTHDSALPKDEDLDYFGQLGLHFNLVSLDCTQQVNKGLGGVHMTFEGNLTLIDKLKERGLVDTQTVFVTNHFSHNGGLNYAEMKKLSEGYGIRTAYDGMVIEV